MLSNDSPELDRETQSLKQLGRAVHPILFDLSTISQRDPDDQLWAQWESQFGPIEALVNNAGIGYQASLADTPAPKMRLIFEVNFFAPALLCQQASIAMASRGKGSIVNVTSASARRSLARMSAYASSKAAMHSLTQSLRMEVSSKGVNVSEVLPISVSTRFFERASLANNQSYQPKGLVQTPQSVAAQVISAIQKGPSEKCTHWPTSWGLGFDALFPNLISRLLLLWQRLSGAS